MKLKSIFQSITTANVLLILLLVVVIATYFLNQMGKKTTTDKFSGYHNQLEKGKRTVKVAKKK